MPDRATEYSNTPAIASNNRRWHERASSRILDEMGSGPQVVFQYSKPTPKRFLQVKVGRAIADRALLARSSHQKMRYSLLRQLEDVEGQPKGVDKIDPFCRPAYKVVSTSIGVSTS